MWFVSFIWSVGADAHLFQVIHTNCNYWWYVFFKSSL